MIRSVCVQPCQNRSPVSSFNQANNLESDYVCYFVLKTGLLWFLKVIFISIITTNNRWHPASFCFRLFFLCCIVRCSPPSDAIYNRSFLKKILSLFSLLAFAFCPLVFSSQFFFICFSYVYIYTFIISLVRSLSLVFRTTMRRSWGGSAADPLGVTSKGIDREGSGRRKSAVDESRLARYQTDYDVLVGRTCLCHSYHKLLWLARRCFCCTSVFLPFPFAPRNILVMFFYCFV